MEKFTIEEQRLLSELQRRQLLIKSEPDGIVRETMIDNLLLDFPIHDAADFVLTGEEEKPIEAIAFARWIVESTHFAPTGKVNEWSALHMGDGWQYATAEQLYEMFKSGKTYC